MMISKLHSVNLSRESNKKDVTMNSYAGKDFKLLTLIKICVAVRNISRITLLIVYIQDVWSLHPSWSHYYYLQKSPIRSHTQYHNQISILINIHCWCTINQNNCTNSTIYTIRLYLIGPNIQTTTHTDPNNGKGCCKRATYPSDNLCTQNIHLNLFDILISNAVQYPAHVALSLYLPYVFLFYPTSFHILY